MRTGVSQLDRTPAVLTALAALLIGLLLLYS
jgi:hypothetical protein